jgi:hypothetical protein
MSALETIFARAMSDPDFARQLFTNADPAIINYVQSANLDIEERKSFAGTTTARGGFCQIREQGG